MSAAPSAEPVLRFVLTPHAELEMARRDVGVHLVRAVLTSPGQRITVRAGRDVLQSRVVLGEPAKEYLVRVVIDVDRDPAEVVTVYRTSRLERYWQEER